jgi:hypothetical protein
MDADAPPAVRAALDDEAVVATVDLRGENALYVTPSRTLHYQPEGLLSEESVAEYAHDAEGVAVSEGRRKATLTFDYGTGGERALTVPLEQVDEALHPVLAGVLSAAGITVPGETITRTYRFSELTLVVTSHRVVKHVGAAAWAADYESVPYEAVTRLDVEEGDVAAQVILETDRRVERIKVPAESIRDVRERVQAALLAYHGADTYEEFRRIARSKSETGTQNAGSEADADRDGGAEADREDPRSAFESADLDPIDPEGDADDAVAADPGPPNVGDGRSATPEDAGDRRSAPDTRTDADADADAADRDDSTAGESPPAGATDPGSSESVSGRAADPAELAARLEELEAVVDRQADLLAEQRELLAEMADALSRDR